MQTVDFPYIDLSIPLKVKTVCKKEEIVDCVDFYSIDELYNLLYKIYKVELGGEYDPLKGFIVDPYTTRYDINENRPYTTLNTSTKIGIVWHSHPFDNDWNSYPSIEDIDMVRMYPELIFLLLTKKGVYVISANKSYTSIDNVVYFYRSMQPDTSGVEWNYEELEESFVDNLCYKGETIEKFGIFCYMISVGEDKGDKRDKRDKKDKKSKNDEGYNEDKNGISIDYLNRVIVQCYSYKEKTIRNTLRPLIKSIV